MSKITEITEKLPVYSEVITAGKTKTLQGRKVQKILFKDFLEFPERFGKGLVAFLATVFTLGLGLFVPYVLACMKDAIYGYAIKKAYLPQSQPTHFPEVSVSHAEQQEKSQEATQAKIQDLVQEQLQKQIQEQIQEQLSAVEPPPMLEQEKMRLFENTIFEKVLAEKFPDIFQKVVTEKIPRGNLTEEERLNIEYAINNTINKITKASNTIKRAFTHSKIPANERKHAIMTSATLTLHTKKWRKASLEEIKSGIFDKDIAACIKACQQTKNRVGLSLIAYSLFSRVSRHYENCAPFRCLKAVLYDELCPLEDVGLVLNRVLSEVKTLDQQWFIQDPLDESCRKEGQYWSPNFKDGKLAPDIEVTFSHGGGFFHFVDILKKTTSGYHLEAHSGRGIQVHPHNPDSSFTFSELLVEREIHDYASKATHYFDLPVRVVGTIRAELLVPAPNLYEAGIHAADLRGNIPVNVEFIKIQNRNIKRSYFEDPTAALVFVVDQKKLLEVFPESPELRASIQKSFSRVSPFYKGPF